jgi:hypothetical protein
MASSGEVKLLLRCNRRNPGAELSKNRRKDARFTLPTQTATNSLPDAIMSPSAPAPLPALGLVDFGPGADHVVEASCQDKVFAILHKYDPARMIIPHLTFAHDDPFVYLFLHGGDEVTRFQNLRANATHEIPAGDWERVFP